MKYLNKKNAITYILISTLFSIIVGLVGFVIYNQNSKPMPYTQVGANIPCDKYLENKIEIDFEKDGSIETYRFVSKRVNRKNQSELIICNSDFDQRFDLPVFSEAQNFKVYDLGSENILFFSFSKYSKKSVMIFYKRNGEILTLDIQQEYKKFTEDLVESNHSIDFSQYYMNDDGVVISFRYANPEIGGYSDIVKISSRFEDGKLEKIETEYINNPYGLSLVSGNYDIELTPITKEYYDGVSGVDIWDPSGSGFRNLDPENLCFDLSPQSNNFPERLPWGPDWYEWKRCLFETESSVLDLIPGIEQDFETLEYVINSTNGKEVRQEFGPGGESVGIFFQQYLPGVGYVFKLQTIEEGYFVWVDELTGDFYKTYSYPIESPGGNMIVSNSFDVEVGFLPNVVQLWKKTEGDRTQILDLNLIYEKHPNYENIFSDDEKKSLSPQYTLAYPKWVDDETLVFKRLNFGIVNGSYTPPVISYVLFMFEKKN